MKYLVLFVQVNAQLYPVNGNYMRETLISFLAVGLYVAFFWLTYYYLPGLNLLWSVGLALYGTWRFLQWFQKKLLKLLS